MNSGVLARRRHAPRAARGTSAARRAAQHPCPRPCSCHTAAPATQEKRRGVARGRGVRRSQQRCPQTREGQRNQQLRSIGSLFFTASSGGLRTTAGGSTAACVREGVAPLRASASVVAVSARPATAAGSKPICGAALRSCAEGRAPGWAKGTQDARGVVSDYAEVVGGGRGGGATHRTAGSPRTARGARRQPYYIIPRSGGEGTKNRTRPRCAQPMDERYE